MIVECVSRLSQPQPSALWRPVPWLHIHSVWTVLSSTDGGRCPTGSEGCGSPNITHQPSAAYPDILPQVLLDEACNCICGVLQCPSCPSSSCPTRPVPSARLKTQSAEEDAKKRVARGSCDGTGGLRDWDWLSSASYPPSLSAGPSLLSSKDFARCCYACSSIGDPTSSLQKAVHWTFLSSGRGGGGLFWQLAASIACRHSRRSTKPLCWPTVSGGGGGLQPRSHLPNLLLLRPMLAPSTPYLCLCLPMAHGHWPLRCCPCPCWAGGAESARAGGWVGQGDGGWAGQSLRCDEQPPLGCL